jgi:serine/threonine protein phosphatase 1
VEWIVLGDIIDRGPDSAEVVERLLRLNETRGNIRFILGNHEEVFLQAMRGDLEALRLFARIGGRETILSYGISERDFEHSDYDELFDLLHARVPARHLAFLDTFERMIERGDYVFVHAGIRPGVALTSQSGSDLRWIRSSFLNHEGDFGAMVVHGHTITDDVEVRHNRLGIDTGAYSTGRLTALGIEGGDRWFLATEVDRAVAAA